MNNKIESEKIGELILSDSSTVKVTKFMGDDGRMRIDLRVWLATQKYSGPTKKGITIPSESIPELVKILSSVT